MDKMRLENGGFYYLNSDSLLISGSERAAIYHLSSGDVYSIDRDGREVLELAEKSIPVLSILTQFNEKKNNNYVVDFLHKLTTLGLGDFSDSPSPPQKVDIPLVSFGLRKVWLELTNRCNLRCIHCYANSSSKNDRKGLTLAEWKNIIEEAAELGAKWIQFIGGEPLIYGKSAIFSLINYAYQAKFDHIEIFTNGTLLDDEYIDFIAKHDVQVALSVYSNEPEVHDTVTQRPGSFEKMMKNIKKLRLLGVSCRFGLVIMKQNRSYEEATLEWMREEFGDSLISKDIVRCTTGGRNQQDTLLTSELWKRRLRSSPSFPKLTLDKFARSKIGNPCLSGEICVQTDGNIYPCIMDRVHLLGNIFRSTLREVIEGEINQEIWRLSKDRILICKDCEYRYACFDCRPQAITVAEKINRTQQELYVKDPCCLYNPYNGDWRSEEEFMEKIFVV